MSAGELSDESIAYLEKNNIKPLLEELFHDVLMHLPDNPLEFLLKALCGKTTLRLIIVGPVGSGKQTQSQLVAQKYGVVHVKAEDVFREEMAKGTEEGGRVALCLREGTPLPNDLAAELITRRLKMEDAASKGWVLDGFPLMRAQALHLQAAGLSPLLVVMLHVPTEVSVERCVGCQKDPATQRKDCAERFFFGRDARRNEEGSGEKKKDDDDGAEAVFAADDCFDTSLAALVRRWKYFDARKDEITECYESFFVCVDGARPVDVVFNEICEQIDFRYLPV